ncbi:MAG: class I SAM-dependent methyltransferase [Erythrobacter sp.]|uniref:class I SAM-dependent methyltransferase n=1 Tax=Erythrobacter sp. TaxID=1042 RepID=UPI00329A542D
MFILAFLLFVPLQLLWLPISVIGAALVGYRQLVVSKRLGLSQTAVEIINGRWTMDVFGLRQDVTARKLAAAIPNNSTIGLWLCLFPLWAVQRLLGRPFLYPTRPAPEKATFANLVPSRTAEFDALIEANAATADQLVILGAGLDTRAYGPLRERFDRIYEVDEAANQAHKRAHLAAAGIDSEHVRFVEADFGQADWIQSLLPSDYDPSCRTVFLWEGVTLYLSQASVSATFETLQLNASADSIVLTDIYAQRIVKLMKNKAIRWSLEMTGEETNFGLDFAGDAEGVLARFASSNGTGLRQHQFLGSNHKSGPFVAIAQLALKSGE